MMHLQVHRGTANVWPIMKRKRQRASYYFPRRFIGPRQRPTTQQASPNEKTGNAWGKFNVAANTASTVVIAVAAIVTGFVGYYQWRALKSTDEATHDAATAAKQASDATIALERPYFFITGKFNKPDGTENSNPQIAYSVANIGRVPGIARVVYANCSLKTVFDGLPNFSKGEFHSAQTAIGGNRTTTDFPPAVCEGMTAENWAAVHSKAKTIIFQAIIMYEGALDYTYAVISTYSVDIDTGYFYAIGGDDYNYDTSERGRGSGKPHPLPKIVE